MSKALKKFKQFLILLRDDGAFSSISTQHSLLYKQQKTDVSQPYWRKSRIKKEPLSKCMDNQNLSQKFQFPTDIILLSEASNWFTKIVF